MLTSFASQVWNRAEDSAMDSKLDSFIRNHIDRETIVFDSTEYDLDCTGALESSALGEALQTLTKTTTVVIDGGNIYPSIQDIIFSQFRKHMPVLAVIELKNFTEDTFKLSGRQICQYFAHNKRIVADNQTTDLLNKCLKNYFASLFGPDHQPLALDDLTQQHAFAIIARENQQRENEAARRKEQEQKHWEHHRQKLAAARAKFEEKYGTGFINSNPQQLQEDSRFLFNRMIETRAVDENDKTNVILRLIGLGAAFVPFCNEVLGDGLYRFNYTVVQLRDSIAIANGLLMMGITNEERFNAANALLTVVFPAEDYNSSQQKAVRTYLKENAFQGKRRSIFAQPIIGQQAPSQEEEKKSEKMDYRDSKVSKKS